jgi:hypothetical protein
MQEFKRRRNMRRYLITSCFVLAVFALFSATQAQADTIDNFTYQDAGNTFSWQLPSSPTILPADIQPGSSFGITDVIYSENDIPQNPASIVFFSFPNGGGFSLFDSYTFQGILSSGPQIYSGSEDAPTFLTGTFSLPDYFGTSNGIGIPATLTIKSVPEPSSLMLLGTGMLALLGLALKKRSHSSIMHRI